MNRRDKSIDIAKAIGIITVVLGHTNSPYREVIYQFHIPLFFFLSGALFNENKTNNMKQYLLSKMRGLYWPFVKFELIFLVFHNLFTYIGFYSEVSDVQLIYSTRTFVIMLLKIITLGGGEQLAGPLWFLISSFEIVIMFAVFIRITKDMGKYSDLILFTGSLVLFYIGCYTDLPRMLSQSLIGMFFFCCGYYFRRYKGKISINIQTAIVAAAIVIILSLFNYVDISKLEITYKWMLIISGLAGIYFVLFVSQVLEGRGQLFWLYCGENTMYILAFHIISFKIVMFIEILLSGSDWKNMGGFPVYQISIWWCIPLTIAGVLFPLGLKRIIDQLTLSRKN